MTEPRCAKETCKHLRMMTLIPSGVMIDAYCNLAKMRITKDSKVIEGFKCPKEKRRK